jgi:hypothetical protein
MVSGAWYENAISRCVEEGIMNGISDTQMNPNGVVTREQFFVMFTRALNISSESTLNKTFADASQIAGYASGSINALVNHGYVKGITTTQLGPKNNIDRASVAALLAQTCVGYVTSDGTITADKAGVVIDLASNVTVTGSADVTVIATKEGAKVGFDNYTGTATVIALKSNATVTNAPGGTTISAAANATGVKANDLDVAAGETIVIAAAYIPPTTTTGGGGGGSSSSNSNNNNTSSTNITVTVSGEATVKDNGDLVITYTAELPSGTATPSLGTITVQKGDKSKDYSTGLDTTNQTLNTIVPNTYAFTNATVNVVVDFVDFGTVALAGTDDKTITATASTTTDQVKKLADGGKISYTDEASLSIAAGSYVIAGGEKYSVTSAITSLSDISAIAANTDSGVAVSDSGIQLYLAAGSVVPCAGNTITLKEGATIYVNGIDGDVDLSGVFDSTKSDEQLVLAWGHAIEDLLGEIQGQEIYADVVFDGTSVPTPLAD